MSNLGQERPSAAAGRLCDLQSRYACSDWPQRNSRIKLDVAFRANSGTALLPGARASGRLLRADL